jgi:hypothetical protein
MRVAKLRLALAAGSTILWLLAGCGGSQVKPLTGGYEEILVTHRGMGEPGMTQHKLAHIDTRGSRSIVWPWVFSDVFIHGDVAIFLGENPGHEIRLFAVQPPEVPLDITSQVVGDWAQVSGKDAPTLTAAAAPIGGKQAANGDLEFYFEFSGGIHPGTNLIVKWSRVPDMMAAVRAHGVEGKDRSFGRYLTETQRP